MPRLSAVGISGLQAGEDVKQEELQKQAVWLAQMNSNWHDIFIRHAKDDKKRDIGVVIVKDLSLDSLKKMAANGYGQAAVIQKGESGFEGWVRVRGMDSKEKEEKVAKYLATTHFGQKEQARADAWGRLAGFDRGDFRVRVVSATGEVARESEQLLKRSLGLERGRDFARER